MAEKREVVEAILQAYEDDGVEEESM